jgi:hypothetical protein
MSYDIPESADDCVEIEGIFGKSRLPSEHLDVERFEVWGSFKETFEQRWHFKLKGFLTLESYEKYQSLQFSQYQIRIPLGKAQRARIHKAQIEMCHRSTADMQKLIEILLIIGVRRESEFFKRDFRACFHYSNEQS